MPPIEVWVSATYFVQVFQVSPGVERITVQSDRFGRDFIDGISWAGLQDIKREVGRGGRFAVEVYPRDADVVGDHGRRHLWVLDQPPAGVGWTRGEPLTSTETDEINTP